MQESYKSYVAAIVLYLRASTKVTYQDSEFRRESKLYDSILQNATCIPKLRTRNPAVRHP